MWTIVLGVSIYGTIAHQSLAGFSSSLCVPTASIQVRETSRNESLCPIRQFELNRNMGVHKQ
jgi:hypothetical protein